MNLIRSLMGRRQFLAAAGLTSASALTLGRLCEAVDPVFQTSNAMASDKPGTAGTAIKYPHLLSPLKIRNVLVKNRIMNTISRPHYLQGPETFPADEVRSYYSDMAKNAAIVTINMSTGKRPRQELKGDEAHFASWDGNDPAVHNYIDQMVEGIHCEGSLVAGGEVGGRMGGVKLEDFVTQAKVFEDMGFDAVWVGSRELKNTEELRPVIEQMQAVRKATSLIIVAFIMPYTPGVSKDSAWYPAPSGPVLEDVVAMAKMLEGTADIIQMKDAGGINNSPSSFDQERGNPFILSFARAIKESGAKIITAPNGGFRDPATNEKFIASGRTDMVAMARPFISDPEYLKKAYEGRGEDWVPCVMCNKCHGLSYAGMPGISVCSVNPKIGLSTSVKSIQAPKIKKKVAVIGGGPAGMKAALVAAERGHRVTLYEKSEFLGGLLRHSDFSPLKWSYRDFKDYLIRQIYKAGVEALLKIDATPEMIRLKGYDAVLIALGSEPVVSRIPGADGGNVWNIVDAYINEKTMGKDVALIGGGDIGTETGIFLAKAGHRVTALTSEDEMIKRSGPHNKDPQIYMYQHMDNLNCIVKATVTHISEGRVNYSDVKGTEKAIQADSVVVYAGLKPKMDEAMKFSGTAPQVLFLGDCTGKAGNVQKAIRSAFFAASQV
jgi:2,4-dienoyl-CoA reductase-like NADH-dependent reductase (Old Yellow Enzyme family)/thioredoxin reductase